MAALIATVIVQPSAVAVQSSHLALPSADCLEIVEQQLLVLNRPADALHLMWITLCPTAAPATGNFLDWAKREL